MLHANFLIHYKITALNHGTMEVTFSVLKKLRQRLLMLKFLKNVRPQDWLQITQRSKTWLVTNGL